MTAEGTGAPDGDGNRSPPGGPGNDGPVPAAGESLLRIARVVHALALPAESVAAGEVGVALGVVARHLDRSIAVIHDERSQLSGHADQIRDMFQRLKAVLGILRAPQAGRSVADLPDSGVSAQQPATVRGVIFAPKAPLTLTLGGVDDFDLLVRLERVITQVPAVASAAIESYQDGDTHFVIHLREPVGSQALVDALEAGLDSPVHVSAAEADPPELRLRLTRAP